MKEFKNALIAVIFSITTALVLYEIMDSAFFKSFTGNPSLIILTILSLLHLGVLLFCWEKNKIFWRRYKNNRRTKRLPLNAIDYILIFSLALVVFLFSIIWYSPVLMPRSIEMKMFSTINICLFVVWLSSAIFSTGKKKKGKLESTGSKTNESQNDNNEGLHYSDSPIKNQTEDILYRKKFIDDLYKLIVALPESILRDSFTIGLHGRWGEGKTSVINLLLEKFKSESDDFLIVRFEPWYFENKEAILKSFYSKIEETVNAEYLYPDFRRTLSKYQKAIATGMSLSVFSIAFNSAEQSVESMLERINRYIKQLEKKILIIMDDLDRLPPKTILMLFKLVVKNTSFDNTVFLLSFDQTVVRNNLQNILKVDPDFLEKIINEQVNLPAIEPLSIKEYLFLELEAFFSKFDVKEQFDYYKETFIFFYDSRLTKLFQNLRHAKRYLNGLMATYPAIKNETNLYDFLLLECIRCFNPALYLDIWRNEWIYIDYPIPFSKENQSKITKSHIDAFFKNSGECKYKRDIYVNLLLYLFPYRLANYDNEIDLYFININQHDSISREKKSISNPECFKKYFMLQVPHLELSDEEIEIHIESINKHAMTDKKHDLPEKIFETIQFLGERYSVLDILNRFRILSADINPKTAVWFVKSLTAKGNELVRGKNGEWNHDMFRSIIFFVFSLINNKHEIDSIPDTMLQVVRDTPGLLFVVQAILYYKKRGHRDFFNIYEIMPYDSYYFKELKYTMRNRLAQYYIIAKRDIFTECAPFELSSILYNWVTDWTDNWEAEHFTTDTVELLDYIFHQAKKNPRRVADVLKIFRDNTSHPNKNSFTVFSKFPNYKVFLQLAERALNEEDLSEEDRRIIEDFLTNPNAEAEEQETVE